MFGKRSTEGAAPRRPMPAPEAGAVETRPPEPKVTALERAPARAEPVV
jgi:hypothetical protein